MNLSLIILVLCVIISVSYFIASRMLKKKEGYSNPLSEDLKEEKNPESPAKAEEKVEEDRLVLSGTFQSTKNKVRKTKDQKDLKEKTPRQSKNNEPAKKGEKRKYSPRKKKEDKGDDLLLS